jgi:hypothetical protein
MDNDRKALEALFGATCGPSRTLEARRAYRQSFINKRPKNPGQKQQQQQQQQSGQQRLQRFCFLRPPEFVSSAAVARGINFLHGRYDDCYEYEDAGLCGPGYYLTDLGRNIGERMGKRVPMPLHMTEVSCVSRRKIIRQLTEHRTETTYRNSPFIINHHFSKVPPTVEAFPGVLMSGGTHHHHQAAASSSSASSSSSVSFSSSSLAPTGSHLHQSTITGAAGHDEGPTAEELEAAAAELSRMPPLKFYSVIDHADGDKNSDDDDDDDDDEKMEESGEEGRSNAAAQRPTTAAEEEEQKDRRKKKRVIETRYCILAANVTCEYIREEEDDDQIVANNGNDDKSNRGVGGVDGRKIASTPQPPNPSKTVSVSNPSHPSHAHLPLLSRWRRLDGWLEDAIIGSFDESTRGYPSATASAVGTSAKKRQSQDIVGSNDGSSGGGGIGDGSSGDESTCSGGGGGAAIGDEVDGGRGRRRLRRQQQMVLGDVATGWFGVVVRDHRVFAVRQRIIRGTLKCLKWEPPLLLAS